MVSKFWDDKDVCILTAILGQVCDEDGYDLLPGAPPPPYSVDEQCNDDDPYFPFSGAAEFKLAEFLFKKVQMSAGNITTLMDIWAELNGRDHDDPNPPFDKSKDLYDTIDAIPFGDVPWQGFSVKYSGEIPANPPSWMMKSYEVWFRDPLKVMESQIGNRDFDGKIDYAPKQVRGKNGRRQFCDLMSGDWAWEQAVCNYWFLFVFYSNSLLGRYCSWPNNSWGHVCSCRSWER